MMLRYLWLCQSPADSGFVKTEKPRTTYTRYPHYPTNNISLLCCPSNERVVCWTTNKQTIPRSVRAGRRGTCHDSSGPKLERTFTSKRMCFVNQRKNVTMNRGQTVIVDDEVNHAFLVDCYRCHYEYIWKQRRTLLFPHPLGKAPVEQQGTPLLSNMLVVIPVAIEKKNVVDFILDYFSLSVINYGDLIFSYYVRWVSGLLCLTAVWQHTLHLSSKNQDGRWVYFTADDGVG